MIIIITDKTVNTELDTMLEKATEDVRPSRKMISFYNFTGNLPLRLGALLMLLTSLDSSKVIIYAGIQKRTDAAIRVLYQYRVRPWRLLWGARGSYLAKLLQLPLGPVKR